MQVPLFVGDIFRDALLAHLQTHNTKKLLVVKTQNCEAAKKSIKAAPKRVPLKNFLSSTSSVQIRPGTVGWQSSFCHHDAEEQKKNENESVKMRGDLFTIIHHGYNLVSMKVG